MEPIQSLEKKISNLLQGQEGIADICSWKDPVVTVAVLLAFNAAFFLLLFTGNLTAMTILMCNMGIIAVLIGALAEFAVPTKVGADAEPLVKELVSKEQITSAAKTIAHRVVPLMNSAVPQVQQVVSWTDTGVTIKALVALEVIRVLTPLMSVKWIIYLVVHAFFLVELVKVKAKDWIDKEVKPTVDKAFLKVDTLTKQIPKFTDVVPKIQVDEYLKVQNTPMSKVQSGAQSDAPKVWSLANSYELGPAGSEKDFKGKAELLDKEKHHSVSATVEELSNGTLEVAAGYCVLYSSSHEKYYVLYRADKKDEIFALIPPLVSN